MPEWDAGHAEPCREAREVSLAVRSELPQVIGGILQTCGEPGLFEHVDAELIPSGAKAREVVRHARRLLFPGYFDGQVLEASRLQYALGMEAARLFDLLAEQIALSVRHDCQRYRMPCTRCQERGQREAMAFLKALPGIRRILATDVQAAYDGDPAAGNVDEVIISYPGVLAVTVHRIAHQLWLQRVPLLPRMISEYAHGITGIDVHPGAAIGRSFFIDHGTGVVIGETTVIGERVRLYQGVTLGALSLHRDEVHGLRGAKRHPTIEDDVTIYAGATVLGGETVIGAGSTIGGNVWITRSVPPGTKVFLTPPKLLYRNDGGSLGEDATP